jgi:hypothetical protein
MVIMIVTTNQQQQKKKNKEYSGNVNYSQMKLWTARKKPLHCGDMWWCTQTSIVLQQSTPGEQGTFFSFHRRFWASRPPWSCSTRLLASCCWWSHRPILLFSSTAVAYSSLLSLSLSRPKAFTFSPLSSPVCPQTFFASSLLPSNPQHQHT